MSKQSKPSSLQQLIRFAGVGGLNTGVDFLVFFLLTHYGHLYYGMAQVLSYSAGGVNSYLLNKRFTFAVKQKATIREVTTFAAVNLASLGVTLALLWLCRDYAGLPLLVSKLISTIFGIGVNFIGTKLLVFRAQPETA